MLFTEHTVQMYFNFCKVFHFSNGKWIYNFHKGQLHKLIKTCLKKRNCPKIGTSFLPGITIYACNVAIEHSSNFN